MINPQHDNRNDLFPCMDTTCDNCGREIEFGPCPFCGFEYRAEEDTEGVYYY